MKIVKYYYSEPTYKINTELIVDEVGRELELTHKSVRKALPRFTVCGIFDMDTRKMVLGISRCSDKDAFVKKVGQKLAYERAEQNPIATIDVLPTETMSSVFFDFARLLENRYLTQKSVKF